MDYQSNSDKNKEPKVVIEKKLEKVVTGEVVQRPRSNLRKFKEIFFGGDAKSTATYVAADVLFPTLRELLWDMISKGSGRLIFGEGGFRRKPQSQDYHPKVRYDQQYDQNPINVTYRDASRERVRLPDQPRSHQQSRQYGDDILVSSREEADIVVEKLIDIADKYDTASRADLYEILGLASTPIDNKWGWSRLNGIEVRQTRNGWLIELPPMEVI